MLSCFAMLTTVGCSLVAKKLEPYLNVRYSSCVTDTPLKLLVTVLDDRSVSRCCAMCCLLDLVLLRSNSGAPLIAFQCFLRVCCRGYLRRCCELAILFTFGIRLFNRQGLYITYDPFYFNQRFAC